MEALWLLLIPGGLFALLFFYPLWMIKKSEKKQWDNFVSHLDQRFKKERASRMEEFSIFDDEYHHIKRRNGKNKHRK